MYNLIGTIIPTIIGALVGGLVTYIITKRNTRRMQYNDVIKEFLWAIVEIERIVDQIKDISLKVGECKHYLDGNIDRFEKIRFMLIPLLEKEYPFMPFFRRRKIKRFEAAWNNLFYPNQHEKDKDPRSDYIARNWEEEKRVRKLIRERIKNLLKYTKLK